MLLSFHFGILINMIEPSYVSLAQYSSLRIGAEGLFIEVSHEEELLDALQYAQKASLKPYIIGSGTNTFFGESLNGFLFIHPALKEVAYNTKGDDVYVTAGAGEMWDNLVKEVTEKGLWGIENLSYIPGTVGAAPVQNIGAYGVSLSDVFVSLRAIDCTTYEIVTLDRESCQFGYRDSLFKQERGRYVVISVTLHCYSLVRPVLTYRPLDALVTYKNMTPTVVRDLVIATRKSKLPEYKEYPNCGSFFKNPVVLRAQGEALRTQYPDLPLIEEGNNYKIPAAWLIEHIAKMKGVRVGDVGTWLTQPLVIVNYGQATAEEVLSFAGSIVERVKKETGIALEFEVNYVSG